MLNCYKTDEDSCRCQLLEIKSACVHSESCHVESNPADISVIVQGAGRGGTQHFELKICHIENLPRSLMEFEKVSPPPSVQEQGYQDQIMWNGIMKTQSSPPPERRVFFARVQNVNGGGQGKTSITVVLQHDADQGPPYRCRHEINLDVEIP